MFTVTIPRMTGHCGKKWRLSIFEKFSEFLVTSFREEEVVVKTIAIVFGMENTFPPALVEKINAMKVDGIRAEFLKIGGIRMDEPKKYDVIIDRISQDIQFYRAYLKNAALHGTIVVNNPFWWTADDKFFNYSLADKLGVAIPPTVILPHNKHPEGTTE